MVNSLMNASRSLRSTLRDFVIERGCEPRSSLELLRSLGESLPAGREELEAALREEAGRALKRREEEWRSFLNARYPLRSISTYGLVDRLLELGVLRRIGIRRFDLGVPREAYFDAIASLEEYFEERTLVQERRPTESGAPLHRHFILRGGTLVRLNRVAEEVIEGAGGVPHLIVPKGEVNGLVLGFYLDSRYDHKSGSREYRLTLYWYDPKFFAVAAPCIDKMLREPGFSLERAYPNYVEPVKALGELQQYMVDPGDRIRLSRAVAEGLRENTVYREVVDKLSGSILEPIEYESDHDRICGILEKMGRAAGYRAVREYRVGDSRIDVAWLREGRVTHVFEVVIGGSVKEALYRLGRVEGARRILVIEDERINEARAEGGIKVIKASRIKAAEQSLDEYLKLIDELI